MRAHTLRSADDCAQIVRIGDAVQQDQEGIFALRLRVCEHLVHRGIGHRRDVGQQALMSGIDLIQPRAVHHLNDHTGLPGHADDVSRRAGQVALRHQQLFHRPSRAQRLPDGIAAAEQVLRISRLYGRKIAGVFRHSARPRRLVALLGIGKGAVVPGRGSAVVIPAAAGIIAGPVLLLRRAVHALRTGNAWRYAADPRAGAVHRIGAARRARPVLRSALSVPICAATAAASACVAHCCLQMLL